MSTGSRSLGSQIFPAISAGLVTGLVNVILCISLAALILEVTLRHLQQMPSVSFCSDAQPLY